MLPIAPTETISPVNLLNLSLGRTIEKTFNDPMNTGAIPIPMRILPENVPVNVVARLKSIVPADPINAKSVIILRGPILSSMGPIKI